MWSTGQGRQKGEQSYGKGAPAGSARRTRPATRTGQDVLVAVLVLVLGAAALVARKAAALLHGLQLPKLFPEAGLAKRGVRLLQGMGRDGAERPRA